MSILARSFFAAYCLSAVFPLVPATAQTAQPVLVHDFAPGSRQVGIGPMQLQTAAGRLFFAATDPAHGLEPWTSDGGAPRRLGDLNHGPGGSNPAGFTELGDTVVFHAHDASESAVIYRLDGDRPTELGRYDAGIAAWQKAGSLVYFTTQDYRLYRSDGTREGTAEVTNLRDGASCPTFEACLPPEQMGAFEGALYFTYGDRLLRVAEGGLPAPLATLREASEFNVSAPGRLVFRGCTGEGACRAYVSDGTAAGTRQLEPATGGTLTLGARNFVPWRGRLYFNVGNDFAGHIASTDGDPAGTRLEPGFEESPALLAATPGHLFYTAYGSHGFGIYSLDGAGTHRDLGVPDPWLAAVGTVGERLLFNHYDYGGIARPGHFILASTNGEPAGTFDLTAEDIALTQSALFGGRLHFSLGGRLWRSDGSVAGTTALPSTETVPDSGAPLPFTLGDGLFAIVPDGFGQGFLWRVDPQTFAAEQVDPRAFRVVAIGRRTVYLRENEQLDARLFAFSGGAIEELPLTGLYRHTLAADDHLFLLKNDPDGQELWESDGSAAGTRRLTDFGGCSALGCGLEATLAASGDFVFFQAQAYGSGLAVWDRRDQQLRPLLAALEIASGILLPLPGGQVAFVKNQPADARTLWVSDGTVAGTRSVFTLPPESQLLKAVAAGNRIFFQLASGIDFQKSLWVSDLSAAGTQQLFSQDRFDAFGGLAAAGDNVFFAADGEAGPELGFSDGTPAGTRVLDLRPGPAGSRPDRFAPLAGGRLLFAAAADEAGYEAWISDGTAAGTARLTDLNPGEAAASPAGFTQLGDRLFFQATDGASGLELWSLALPGAGGECTAEQLCLHGGRFRARAVAHVPDGDFPGRRAVAGEQSGIFSFFSADNWELMVKVLDGCQLNGRFWVFGAAATDAGFDLEVTDLASGRHKTYRSAFGVPARAITDSDAFPCD